MIAVLRGEGRTLRFIAKKMKRDPGTLSRELKRNAPPVHTGYYLPHKAHERALNRNRESHQRERLKNPTIRSYVRQRIKADWSPELTAGRWNSLHSDYPISHEAVYQWIYADAKELIPYLVRAHKKRERRGYSRKHKKSHIPNRISISERPKEAERRRVAGHWETDTAVSRQSKVTLQATTERRLVTRAWPSSRTRLRMPCVWGWHADSRECQKHYARPLPMTMAVKTPTMKRPTESLALNRTFASPTTAGKRVL